MLEVQGYGGMVVSPHILSTQAGMEALDRAGSAVDAAIAANAVQGMVAPETCGIGGDLFALVHDGTEVTALNSSGWAGSNVSADRLRDEGLTSIPQHHPAGVTIPGCVAGWFALHERFGRLPLADLLRRAIEYGREGFAASTEYSRSTHRMADFLADNEAGAQLLLDGRPPLRGERVRRPNLSDTLQRIADHGPTAFYEGPVAESISEAVDGLITPEDLAAYRPDWVDPISIDVFGVTGWTIPPNSQGYITLAALALFEQLTPTLDPGDPRWAHLLIEAYRAVAAERDDVVADPAHAPVPPEILLEPIRLGSFASGITADGVARRSRPAPKPGGTMFMCAIDDGGMGISLIESNFRGIGSGLGAGRSGFILHDRGGGFDLRSSHPNEIGPHKRPLHTLAPTLWTSGDRLRSLLGTRGGYQQPQLLAQIAALLFGAGRSPGAAQSEPRWTMTNVELSDTTSTVDVESDMSRHIVDGLTARGHTVRSQAVRSPGWGPVSVIDVATNGLRTGAADPRVDTAAAATR
ncbi:MAG TPA: gamma-glutamyltransferase [Acidimicrobiia bacterium]|nr:gamma-glutamyltransferase [Acidimicrobiia bacterium]